MSQKIRQGNDIRIRWSILDADEHPYILEGRNVAVELNVGTKRVRIKSLEIESNVLIFTYYGKDQKYTGSYILKFIENEGQVDMVTFDTKDAFTLVEHSWQATDEGETPETVQLEFVTVSSELMEKVGPAGPYFTPAVDGEGNLSWTNNGGLPNPETVNIKGPKGDTGDKGDTGAQGPQGPQGPKGDDAAVTAENIEEALGYVPQEELKSGVNIKTINGESILGRGNIEIQGGGTVDVDDHIDHQSTNPVENRVIADALDGKEDNIQDLSDIRSGASLGATAYQKPGTGIPSTDMESAVQTSLGKADTAVQPAALQAVTDLIPAQATAQNQLADKNFVNSSIATNTATFKGTYNLVSDLSLTTSATEQQIAAALASEITGEDNNDYAFVQVPTADATPTEIAHIDRYKYNGTAWSYEYQLNNSSFTAAQWAAINSNITAAKVTKLDNLPTKPVDTAVQSLSAAEQLQARTNIGATAPEIFFATYGTTTYADIVAASSAGKIVAAKRTLSSNIYTYVAVSVTPASVAFMSVDFSTNRYIEVSNNDIWAPANVDLQRTTYRKSEWSATPSDSNYPSEKLVKESIDAVDKVFLATYGNTTYADVVAAHNAGKAVVCIYNGKQYILAVKESSYAGFFAYYDKLAYLIKVTSGDVWSAETNSLQSAYNITQSLTNASETWQYPSAKCVYDALDSSRQLEKVISEDEVASLDEVIQINDSYNNPLLELTPDGIWVVRDRFLKGKSIRIFGGSVARALDIKYDTGDIIRAAGATLLDSAESGAGYANNIHVSGGDIVYDDVNIQQQVDAATASDQEVYDIYILWSSTNDLTTYSINVGTPTDYTADDSFDVNSRLTQDGAINYCIKKLCEFAPQSKVVIIGSLKRFEDGGGYSDYGAGLTGRMKSLVDGQQSCAQRFSIPFFSLFDNSGINEYNNDTYMTDETTQHNDGTHPNRAGYVVIVEKILNFLKTI